MARLREIGEAEQMDARCSPSRIEVLHHRISCIVTRRFVSIVTNYETDTVTVLKRKWIERGNEATQWHQPPNTGARRIDAAEKPARERVFAVAADLCLIGERHSRRSGVEEIVNKAGVAKISLYRSFKSKDDLIVAYLEQRNAEFWRQWDGALRAAFEDDPRALLDAIMDYLARRTTQAGYRGCPFINYAVEFPEASHPGHRVVEANKREWRRRFTAISEALGAPKPKLLADSLLLLVEGAYAVEPDPWRSEGSGRGDIGRGQGDGRRADAGIERADLTG